MRTNKFYKIDLLKWVISLVMTSLLYVGCNTTVEPNISDFGYDYYPVEVGTYKIYHTSTIRYNLNGSVDSVEYLVKEVAEDSIIYSDGSTRVVLGRYSADLEGEKWQKDSLWAVLKDDSKIVVSEANVDFIKMVFPIKESITWDGNAVNSKESEAYRMEQIGKKYAYDTLSYNNTLTVVQADLLDPAKITSDDYRVEIFAVDVGLIHKLNSRINYCSSCTENGKIDDGYIFEQKLIEIGKE